MPSNLKQYSRHLKYTIGGSQQFVYNNDGQGQLDVNEMLASRPCWREFEMGVKEAPKTLILADWSASLWSDEEIAEKKQKLSQMLSDGFQLFIVQKGELIPLENINSLDNYKVRKDIIPSSAENLINNAINKYNLTRDQILVLDQASIHLLNQEELPETQTIRIDLRSISDSVKRHQLFESLANLSPPVRNIIFFADDTPQENKYRFLEPILKRQLPNTNISFVKQKRNGKDEFMRLGMLRMSEVEKGLTLENPLEIECLFFDYHEISSPDVEKLFKKYAHVKKIHINDSPIDPSLYETPFLQNLHIRHNFISQKVVENLLNKNSSLQSVNLGITCCNEFSKGGPLSIVNQLPALETFSLHARSSVSLNIAELLDCAKNLKHLTLAQTEVLFTQSEKLPTLVLESLELAIDGKKDFESLLSLLEKMPHLTKLNLKNSHNITLQQLKTILQRFPNIISFDFVELHDTEHPYFAFFSDPELMSLLKNRLLSGDRQQFGKYELSTTQKQVSQVKEAAERKEATEKKTSSSKKPVPLKDDDFIRQASTFTKTAQDFQFEFDADKDSNDFNQMNIINAVSQYILLTGQPRAWLPQINDGICQALSELYATTDSNEWSDRLQKLIRWDGTASTLDDSLRTTLDSIMARVTAIYSPERQSAPHSPIHYLGDNLDSFIASLRKDQKNVAIYLRNAGHRIAIKYNADQDFFEIYDPNHKKGIQIIPCNDASFLKTVGHQLHQALGPLISYIKLTPNQQLPEYSNNTPIRNYEHFIKNNGLLNAIFNPTLLEHVLVFKIEALPQESLSGILLRDVSGIPAWFSGIRSTNEPIKKYTFDLLNEFIRKDPDYYKKIQKSLENATSMQKHAAIEAVLSLYQEPSYQNNSSYKQLLNELPAIIRTTPHTKKHYELQFSTWQSPEVFNKPLNKFCQEVVGADKKKQLIELESSEEIHALRLALESQCIDNKRPVFYVNSPKDLVCSSPTVRRGGNNEGIFETEFPPDAPVGYGPLYDFLMTNKEKNPVIIVNYEQFKADDMVKFNSLLDKKRVIDGVPVPETASIIGLVNKKNPNSYHGSDFYSRFGKDNQQKCPVAKEELKHAVLPLPLVNQASSVKNAPVETLKLYHAKDWREKLLGQWKIAGEQLIFVPGQLPDPILPNTVFEIENGLWQLPEFKQFWEEALVRGEILSHGRRIAVPKNIHLVKKEGYSWDNLQHSVQWSTEVLNDAVCINPSNVSQLFYRYQCDNDTQQLNTIEGLIEKAAKENGQLNILLTRSLNEDSWAMILDACKKSGITLRCTCAKGVSLPNGLTPATPVHQEKTPDFQSSTIIYQSTDNEAQVEQIIQTIQPNEQCRIIDLSECQPGDLLGRLNGALDKTTNQFHFTETLSFLRTKLDNNETIILKGTLSTELGDALAPLLHERQLHPANGKLILVTEDASELSHLPVLTTPITAEDKQRLLTDYTDPQDQVIIADNIEKPFCVIKTLLTQQRIDPTKNAWDGIEKINHTLMFQDFDLDNVALRVEQFTNDRINKVNNVLKHSSYVYLTGLSGVGKTTFVQEQYGNHPNIKLYMDEHNIEQWANDTSDKQKILFIDEANIGHKDWSQFEGLFNKPPSIFINGQYLTLTDQHKVIFAGNPLSYGKGRHAASLFQKHGNAVAFDVLPLEFIYQKILAPILVNSTITEANQNELCKKFLNYYRFLCECSTDEILISPRELEMMALLTEAYCQKNPNANPLDVADHYAYQIAQTLVPQKEQEKFRQTFARDCPPLYPSSQAIEICKNLEKKSFVVTSSRQNVVQQVSDLLALRELRQQPNRNEKQCYGGLGGLIIEGEPGIGKSDLILNILENVTENQDKRLRNKAHETPSYHYLPASVGFDEKKKRLIAAFHAGEIIVIDEINSSPLMERLLNHLLMGYDAEGKRAQKPGFMIIGTQNPVTFAGRSKQSTALARRMTTTLLPEYTQAEMQEIILQKGIAPEEVENILTAYQKQANYAKAHHLTPAPTFRDVMNTADNVLKSTLPTQQEQILSLEKHLGNDLVKGNTPIQNIASLITETDAKGRVGLHMMSESAPDTLLKLAQNINFTRSGKLLLQAFSQAIKIKNKEACPGLHQLAQHNPEAMLLLVKQANSLSTEEKAMFQAIFSTLIEKDAKGNTGLSLMAEHSPAALTQLIQQLYYSDEEHKDFFNAMSQTLAEKNSNDLTGLQLILQHTPAVLSDLFTRTRNLRTPEGRKLLQVLADSLQQTTSNGWSTLDLMAKNSPKALHEFIEQIDNSAEGRATLQAITQALLKRDNPLAYTGLHMMAKHAPQALLELIKRIDNSTNGLALRQNINKALKIKGADGKTMVHLMEEHSPTELRELNIPQPQQTNRFTIFKPVATLSSVVQEAAKESNQIGFDNHGRPI